MIPDPKSQPKKTFFKIPDGYEGWTPEQRDAWSLSAAKRIHDELHPKGAEPSR